MSKACADESRASRIADFGAFGSRGGAKVAASQSRTQIVRRVAPRADLARVVYLAQNQDSDLLSVIAPFLTWRLFMLACPVPAARAPSSVMTLRDYGTAAKSRVPAVNPEQAA